LRFARSQAQAGGEEGHRAAAGQHSAARTDRCNAAPHQQCDTAAGAERAGGLGTAEAHATAIQHRQRHSCAAVTGRPDRRPAAAPPAQGRWRSVRRGRQLLRRLPVEGRDRIVRWLRHQPGARDAGQGVGVLDD
ncbi:hypothetical protein CEE95_14830, partial [Lactobacillus crispatus]